MANKINFNKISKADLTKEYKALASSSMEIQAKYGALMSENKDLKDKIQGVLACILELIGSFETPVKVKWWWFITNLGKIQRTIECIGAAVKSNPSLRATALGVELKKK